jgi:hypothetical protein
MRVFCFLGVFCPTKTDDTKGFTALPNKSGFYFNSAQVGTIEISKSP